MRSMGIHRLLTCPADAWQANATCLLWDIIMSAYMHNTGSEHPTLTPVIAMVRLDRQIQLDV